MKTMIARSSCKPKHPVRETLDCCPEVPQNYPTDRLLQMQGITRKQSYAISHFTTECYVNISAIQSRAGKSESPLFLLFPVFSGSGLSTLDSGLKQPVGVSPRSFGAANALLLCRGNFFGKVILQVDVGK